MHEIANQIVSLPSSLPDMARGLGGIVIYSATGGYIARDAYASKITSERYAMKFDAANSPVLEQSIIDVASKEPIGKKVVNSVWQRRAASYLLAGALGLSAGSLVEGFSVNTQSPSAIIVDQASLSTIYTHDVNGMSRLDASEAAINQFNGLSELALESYAANSQLVYGMTGNYKAETSQSSLTNNIDTNGNNLTGALQSIENILKHESSTHKAVDIITDGVEIDPTGLKQEANKLKKLGAKITVIALGKSSGASYEYNGGGQQNSDAQTNVLIESFGVNSVHGVDSVAGIKKYLAESVKSSDTHTKPWLLPYAIAAGLALWSLSKLNKGKTKILV